MRIREIGLARQRYTPLMFRLVLANSLLVAEIIAGSAYKTDWILRLYLVAEARVFTGKLKAGSKADETN